ncbi:MAG: hypothetical protein DMF89_09270, partial [Acidobacteria bacterium]
MPSTTRVLMLIASVVNRNPRTVTRNRNTKWTMAGCLIVLVTTVGTMSAQTSQDHAATVVGHVLDPLGGAIAHATATLLHDEQSVTDTTTDESGRFSLASAESGRYRVRVEAPGFEPRDTY